MKSVIPLLYFILLISVVSVAQIPTNHLKLWLQADQNVTYTTTVSAWNDCSGNSNNAIQATASKQPTYTSVNAGINNKPALTFDGTNDEMLGTTITDINLNSMSVFIVARNNSLPSTGSARGMFSVGAYGSGGFELMRGSAGQFGYYQKSSNFNSGNTDDCSTDGTPFRVYCATKQVGTISKIYVNSVFRSSSTLANIISTFTNAAYKIGYFSLSPYYWNGQIAEIVVYDTLLTDTQRLQVETYLMDKYTPVFSLGSDINIGYGFCDTTLSVPSGFSNILWSTGATTQSIQVHTSGTYFVQARDNFNRMRYDTIQVSFPQVVLPNSTICLGDSVFYEVNLSGSYTYLWSDNSTSSSAYFHTEGLHSVQISDTNSCSLTPAFFVDVDSFPQRIDLGADTSLCSGNQIRLIVGENLCSTFLWLPGNETTPQRTVTESGLYKLTATNTNGCTASDSLFVTIQGLAPTPVFTVDNLCFGDVVQCNDFSVHPDSIQSFTWIFNATDTLYSQNPQYQFAAPGTHSIRLVLESFSGCVNDSVALVVVKPLPEVSFSWLPVCAGIPVDFEAETQVPSGVNIVSWNWLVNGISKATTENFAYTFNENGTAAVELIVEADNACFNSFDTLVNVAGSYPVPEYLSLISPSDNYFASTQNVNFVWNIADNALFYELILSESADFTDELFHSDRLFVTEYVFSLPASFDTIYWKVVAFNPCLESMTSEVHRLIDFNPGWISSVKLWVNADNTVITDGKVTQLTDLSGNNFHLTQSNTSNAPTKIGNQLAGYPVIRFNGTNNYMTTSFGQTFAQPNTFFVIFKLDDNAIRYVYDGLIGFNSLRYNSGELQMRAGSSVLGYTRSAPFGFVLSRQVFDGANSRMFENGQLKQSGTLTVNTLSGMTLGSLNSLGNYYFKGDIAELIYCNAALTEAEVSSVRQYLSNKYAQPVNLGPDIRISYGFCDTAISTANKPWFTSYQWSTGETTPVITVNRSGVYTVTVTDMFGFQSSDDIRVFYPEFQEFADTIVCLGQQVVWETNVSGNYSFSWYGSSETGSSLSISVPGNYAAIVSDTLGCQYLSDTISFGFDYYETEASVGPADTIICTGNTLQLLNLVPQTVSYLWNTGSVLPGIVISEPGQYSVITTNWRNCIAYDTIQVAIKGIAPVPGFDVLNLCTGQPTLFTNGSYHPDSIQSYQWVINHTDTLQTPDISYTFATPGNHDVELFIETFSGCTADTLAVLNIQSPPVPSFTYYSLCAGVEMDFVAQAGLPPGSEVSAYRWYVDGVLSGSESILPYTFAGDGHYQLRLEVDLNNLCSAAYEESVNVVAAYPNPEYLSLITPPNGYIYSEPAQQFVWNMADNALFYEFQVSADATFASLLYSSGNITATSYSYDIPETNDTIYWRVLAYNPCNVLMQSEQHLMHRFSPASIPGLSLWIHADSVQIVNGKIAQIDDQSGNNYDLTQATDANRPVKVTNQLAGHPVMRFNGTSNFLTTDFEQSYAQPNTVFSIFKMSDGQSRYLYDGNTGFHALRYVGGDLEMRVGTTTLGYPRSVISGFILSEQIFNTTNSKMFENGQLKKSGTLPEGSLSGFKLGTYNVGGNYYFKGDLAELVLFNRVLSDSETASLRQYFSNKYSEPVNLGPDIRIAYGFCDTSIVNAYKPWFTSYQWSTGETDSVITVNRSGVYTVTVTDMFGFQSSDDIRVFYPEFQEFADTIVCLGQQVVWETNVSG
ncbi:MAG: hypothetical protein KA793_05265, partial [Bacteroidales bacterium]|nr:hypothetical protein [Bacteroidales bacterium]